MCVLFNKLQTLFNAVSSASHTLPSVVTLRARLGETVRFATQNELPCLDSFPFQILIIIQNQVPSSSCFT